MNEYEENPTIDRDNFQGQVFLNVKDILEKGNFNPTKLREALRTPHALENLLKIPPAHSLQLLEALSPHLHIEWEKEMQCNYLRAELEFLCSPFTFLHTILEVPFGENPEMYPYPIVKCWLSGEGEILNFTKWGIAKYAQYANGNVQLEEAKKNPEHHNGEWVIYLPLCCVLNWEHSLRHYIFGEDVINK